MKIFKTLLNIFAYVIIFVFVSVATLTVILMQDSDFNQTFDMIFETYFRNEEVLAYNEDFIINELTVSSSTYYYNQLNDSEKHVYELIANAVKILDTRIDISKIITDDIAENEKIVKNAITYFFMDHPEVYYLDNSYSLYTINNIIIDMFVVELSYDFDNINDLNVDIQKLDVILEEIVLRNIGISDFEKELFFHDYIVSNSTYYEYENIEDIAEKYHTIEGILTENTGVCDALSKTMQILLDKVGIESILVTGVLENEDHAWLMVNINKSWYHLDVTSDMYVKDDDGNILAPVHTYFNVTENEIKETHDIADKEMIPEAVDEDLNYYNVMGFSVLNKYNTVNEIKNIIKEQQDNPIIEFKAVNISDVTDSIFDAMYQLDYKEYRTDRVDLEIKYYKQNDTYIILN